VFLSYRHAYSCIHPHKIVEFSTQDLIERGAFLVDNFDGGAWDDFEKLAECASEISAGQANSFVYPIQVIEQFIDQERTGEIPYYESFKKEFQKLVDQNLRLKTIKGDAALNYLNDLREFEGGMEIYCPSPLPLSIALSIC
jgi:hypothetical protein